MKSMSKSKELTAAYPIMTHMPQAPTIASGQASPNRGGYWLTIDWPMSGNVRFFGVFRVPDTVWVQSLRRAQYPTGRQVRVQSPGGIVL